MKYDELLEAWKSERERLELKSLEKDFHDKLKQYVESLLTEIETLDEGTIRRRLLDKEVENTRWLISKLIELRNGKILEATLESRRLVSPEAFTHDEEQIYNTLETITKAKKLLKEATEGYASHRKSREKEEHRKVLIRFLQAVPSITGADMKMYGPFKVEDVASLPIENAEALIKKEVAVKVETR